MGPNRISPLWRSGLRIRLPSNSSSRYSSRMHEVDRRSGRSSSQARRRCGAPYVPRRCLLPAGLDMAKPPRWNASFARRWFSPERTTKPAPIPSICERRAVRGQDGDSAAHGHDADLFLWRRKPSAGREGGRVPSSGQAVDLSSVASRSHRPCGGRRHCHDCSFVGPKLPVPRH